MRACRTLNLAVSQDFGSRLDRYFEARPSAPEGARPSLLFSSLGGEEKGTPYGSTLVLSRTYAWDRLPGNFSWQFVRDQGFRPAQLNPNLPHHVPLSGLACLDIETTGLSLGTGTVAFLVGVVHAEPGGVKLSQFLIRDFPEEAAQQHLLSEHMSRFDVLCTYNGARFDLPILHSRSVLHRIEAAWLSRPHLDLLYPVRSIGRSHWPDCRLATAELRLLGVVRHQDCEGWEVPLRFRQFLQVPSESILLDVLEHNAQDLISLLCLVAAVQRIYGEDTDGFGLSQAELLGLARSLAMRGRTDAGLRMYRRATAPGRLASDYDNHMRHYVRLLKRQSLWDEAREAWRGVLQAPGSSQRTWALLEEAKFLEHREKRPDLALEVAQNAQAAVLDLAAGPSRTRLAALVAARCERLERSQKPR